MDSSRNECSSIIAWLSSPKAFQGESEEGRLIDQFIGRYRDGKFPKEVGEVIRLLQTMASGSGELTLTPGIGELAPGSGGQLQYKPLQLLRFCTKSGEYRDCCGRSS